MLSSSRGSKKLTIANVIKFSNYKSSVLHTELRVSTLVLFICLLFIISIEVTLFNYSQHLLFILISLISQSPISPIKFLICALIFIKLVISASMLYTFQNCYPINYKLLASERSERDTLRSVQSRIADIYIIYI